MDDAAAIALADAQLACRGMPTSAIRPGLVHRPPKDVTEVVFAFSDAVKERRGFDVAHRVFVGSFGHYIGAIRDDGTVVEHIPQLQRIRDELPIETASRHLQYTLDPRLPTDMWVPRIVDPPRLLSVWYGPEADNTMGGDYEVFLVEPGLVIRVERYQ